VPAATPSVTVLAGGVGAARLLTGLVRAVPPASVTAVVNTGDDMVLHGLAISPDLDTVTYTVAGAIDPERGWGLRDETWQAMATLDRYGGATWFGLGDRDLGTHLYRTERQAEGAPLSTVTDEIARGWGLELTVLPVTDHPLRTMITLAETGEEVGFQDYFVARRHAVPVKRVRRAPGVLDAIAGTASTGPIETIGLDGATTTVAAPAMASRTPGAGRASGAPANRTPLTGTACRRATK